MAHTLTPSSPWNEPRRRGRSWCVIGAVMLIHAGAIGWFVNGLVIAAGPSAPADRLIMASVVMDSPAPPVPKPPPKSEVQPKPQATTNAQPSRTELQLTPTPTPTPASTSATPAHSAPVVAASAPPASSSQPSPSTASAATVVLPSTDAAYLSNPAPTYPRLSKRLGEQGVVVIRVFISTQGLAEKAEVRASSGYARLDDVALATVQRWRFVPGKRGAEPEAMWFNVPIRFVLD